MEKVYGLMWIIAKAQRELDKPAKEDPMGYRAAVLAYANEHIEKCVERDK